jgi:hypothetical protein
MRRSVSWSVYALTADTVFIVDDDLGGRSVTNAAEQVCRDCFATFGNRAIVYRDTMGRWDRLVHAAGLFVGFAPFAGVVPTLDEPTLW